ncbi:Heme O synthase, protoheme IX farnesyltransferase COX10-CtaB [Liberibacter crescens BT-1]|uniref:Protoheme IX farnesyltransferase n=1 Tax=Liberibacter crescens (strain BT-1) TaxID=1215343 RepID=L0EV01_LIBCB|nr:heme o synthase [Liberibacter crescens]AGA64216.1 Heme O synthase, protoheme IX farnesyltransferase COX10-CtaB [Liberibacter crescens BT-1]AMC12464.1 protoheme IX farnesyltransferase [Liberibacter crescens]
MAITNSRCTICNAANIFLHKFRIKDFFKLLKPRVMSLVVFTSLAGLILAPGHIGIIKGMIAIFSIAMGAGASGALNMWYDADIDKMMLRTALRPIPTGKITPREAFVFGSLISVLSVMIMALFINWMSAILLLLAILFYVVIYTIWLKRSTPQNIVIGGIAGAFPPMIGWSSVTGGLSLESMIMFAIIFLWTPPHFWSLALFTMKDYAAAGIPMLPNVATEKATKVQILIYAVLTALTGVSPYLFGFARSLYAFSAVVLGCMLVYFSLRIFFIPEGDKKMVPAKKLFKFSIIYLFALFAALMIDHLIIIG